MVVTNHHELLTQSGRNNQIVYSLCIHSFIHSGPNPQAHRKYISDPMNQLKAGGGGETSVPSSKLIEAL